MLGLFAPKGPFKVSLVGGDQQFQVAAGDNLLKAALAAGIAWPHSCRVGSCGTCRCRLVEGKIKALNDFSYVLDKADLDGGMILACQSALRGDIRVEIELEDVVLATPETVPGAIESMTRLTHDIVEVGIRLEQALPAYRAGQYAELSVAGIERPRSYSFARAPHLEDADHVRFHVRHVPGGEMSGWFHARDRAGTEVKVFGPHGSFFERRAEGPMLCVAGGSGMAPIKALLESMSLRSFERDVTYLFGARTRKDLYCSDEMDQLARSSKGRLRFVPVLSSEPADSDWTGARGMVTEHLGGLPANTVPTDAYLCGPPPMIDAAIAALGRLGLNNKRIYFDKFLDASHLGGRTR